MILSGGVLRKSPTVLWQGSPATFPGWGAIPLGSGNGYRWAAYGELYKQQIWVSAVVNKLARGTARLPLKVYLHDDLNRPEAQDSPYGRLLARPHPRLSRFFFWLWVSSTFDVYGEAFLLKIRDPAGTPYQLWPLHPTCMHDTFEDGETVWEFRNNQGSIQRIAQSELVHFRTYNPDSTTRGMSPLEPLRRTLEFEDAAQRAQSSFWHRGARPGVALKHPRVISQEAQDRLLVNWERVAGGADRTGASVILEEGMTPEVLTISANEAQYIDSRKLNREEVCGEYDVPPPAVHILDRATFSNITEQLRSMYRDTHAPRLNGFEGTLESDLRSSVFPGNDYPDFGSDYYAEFLLDEVLRGDFEARAEAYQKADYMTIAEKRRSENLPFIEGTDRILVNAAQVPLDASAFNLVGVLVRAGYDPESVLSTIGLPPIQHSGNLPVTVQPEDAALSPGSMRSVMGGLSNVKELIDVDVDRLVAGLDDGELLVRTALAASIAEGHTVPQFRDRLRAVAGG